ncbi:serine/threonine-protein kinase pim-1-like [Sinocyclocheilus grahami]|uniref:serine/threonine-protein kinase pim-1-like n=1 Tax=Sinocyclocheilus grahami TaxID=75366 RepID=UPI0007ACD162|nr:PREDICTED: serine/threonine-protein kinase pim-1-like [Sinocyclocheilus grahami]
MLFYLLIDYIFSRYTIGDQLGKGGFGVVYEGRRLEDDLNVNTNNTLSSHQMFVLSHPLVALKYVTKTQHTECIFFPDHPVPLPKEIALTILANKGPSVPEIIRLLDWQDHPDHFVMVLECSSPCENLVEFMRCHSGSLDEETARQNMWQSAQRCKHVLHPRSAQLGKGGFGVVYEGRRLADDLKVALKYVTKTAHRMYIHCVTVEALMKKQHGKSCGSRLNAANMCCLRGVLHRDVKLDNLLINRETSEVKLIDFGCGDILRRSPYKSYHGTAVYSPPEYHSRGKYYGRPATVWSPGGLMFTMLCGRFPSDYDLFLLHYKHWSKPGLSKGEIFITKK